MQPTSSNPIPSHATDVSAPAPLRIVVMGVCGSGKTSIGTQLASSLRTPFIDADDLHPPRNIAKMRSGAPLSDSDRYPWLTLVSESLSSHSKVVVACSALKKAYRDHVRTCVGGTVVFVYLKVGIDVVEKHVKGRAHFMPVGLVASQFETLEEPLGEEAVVCVRCAGTVEETVEEVLEGLRGLRFVGKPSGKVDA